MWHDCRVGLRSGGAMRRFLVAAVVGLGLFVPRAHVAAAPGVPSTCKLAPAVIQRVLGVSGPDQFAGPELIGASCSWRTTDPNCFLRTLSIRTYRTARDVATVDALRRKASSFDSGPASLGSRAFFARPDLGPMAAIAIERLYVAIPKGGWLEVGLAGRLGFDGGHDLLIAAAEAVPPR